jgi:uncharacterized protein Usg
VATTLIIPKSHLFACAGCLTAKILYPLPDAPSILQTFVTQMDDEAPGFPELHSYIEMWREKIIAPIREIWIWHRPYSEGASEWRRVDREFTLQ